MAAGRSRRLAAALDAPLDASALAAFRIAVGLLVTLSAGRWFAYGWIDEYLVRPKLLLRYWCLGWVPVPGAVAAHALFGALLLLGLMFAAGVAYRATAITLFLCFTWVQLLDVSLYLNHYYLVSLLLFLMMWMPLGRASLRGDATLPAWMTWLLRFQVACVYVYAGKAKLTSDWLLHAQPLNIWLSARTQTPLVGPLFAERWMAYAFSWGGFLFDSTVPLWLSLRRTRPFAYAVVIGFHLATMALFPIGLFPLIMIVAALIFFPPDWPRRLLARVAPRPQPTLAPTRVRPLGTLALGALAVYCVIQALLPLRQHAYGGEVLWGEEGMRWSWKVMVREKNASVTFVVEDRASGRVRYVSPRAYLDARQERELGGQPDLILQLAHRIRDDERAAGRDVRVRVDALVSLNGRAPRRLIDETVDLAAIDDSLAKKPWILPAPSEPPIHLRAVR